MRLTPDMSALSYIFTSPPRRVFSENLQQEIIRKSRVDTMVTGELKGNRRTLLLRKNTGPELPVKHCLST